MIEMAKDYKKPVKIRGRGIVHPFGRITSERHG